MGITQRINRFLARRSLKRQERQILADIRRTQNDMPRHPERAVIYRSETLPALALELERVRHALNDGNCWPRPLLGQVSRTGLRA